MSNLLTQAGTQLSEQVQAAKAAGRRLIINGSGSKRGWLPNFGDANGELLSTSEVRGIVAYEPEELVVTALAGTPIRELEMTLAQQDQMLAFEPPQFYAQGTVGGMISSGLSGPSRPWFGSVRDALLGISLVNGAGECLNFGGQVMKNVAGYDVSRLVAGAFGALGVVTAASLRVQPRHQQQQTLHLEMNCAAAVRFCRSLAQQYNPVTGTWWHDGVLSIRLGGSEAAVSASVQKLGGQAANVGTLWQDIRDHKHEFFKASLQVGAHQPSAPLKLCRVILPPAAPQDLPGVEAASLAVEWAGGLRWLWHDEPQQVRAWAESVGGWVWVLGEAASALGNLSREHLALMTEIKKAFDPAHLFVSPLNFAVVETADEPAHAH